MTNFKLELIRYRSNESVKLSSEKTFNFQREISRQIQVPCIVNSLSLVCLKTKSNALELSITIASTKEAMYDKMFLARIFCRTPNVRRTPNDSEV